MSPFDFLALMIAAFAPSGAAADRPNSAIVVFYLAAARLHRPPHRLTNLQRKCPESILQQFYLSANKHREFIPERAPLSHELSRLLTAECIARNP